MLLGFLLADDGLRRAAEGELIAFVERSEKLLQLAAGHGGQQAHFGGGQVLVGRHEREAGRRFEIDDDVGGRAFA